jgi:succinate-semialdehyde dehydrogenase/glutarate-semialdehyde dehydrogenase
MPSADLDKAVGVAVTARVQNNGQSCIAGKRFIVHADVYDRFAALFADRLSALVVGDPMDPATQVGPLATESGRRRQARRDCPRRRTRPPTAPDGSTSPP